MRKMFIRITLLVVAVVAFISIGFAFNGFGLTITAYAEELEYTATGSCGTSANWYYYEETSTLRIDGSGSINTYNVGATPWYSYRDNIKKIIVSDDITSISASLFSGMSALEELTVPFVGNTKTSRDDTRTFGYMFGTTTYTNAVKTTQYYYNSNNSTAHSPYISKDYYISKNLTTVTITNSSVIYYDTFDGCCRVLRIIMAIR